jgi:hypothetical protein
MDSPLSSALLCSDVGPSGHDVQPRMGPTVCSVDIFRREPPQSVFFYFDPYRKLFYKWTLGQTFSIYRSKYRDKRHPSWCPKCIVGQQGQWRPSMSSWKVVVPHRTRRAPPSLTSLGHDRTPTRLAPFPLYQFGCKPSSSLLFLSSLPHLSPHCVPPPAI